MVAQGSIISAATVRNSVLSTDVVVEEGTTVEGSVLMPGVRIGKGAVVRHCILDKNVVVCDGTLIGVDRDRDSQRFQISPGGVVVVGKTKWSKKTTRLGVRLYKTTHPVLLFGHQRDASA